MHIEKYDHQVNQCLSWPVEHILSVWARKDFSVGMELEQRELIT